MRDIWAKDNGETLDQHIEKCLEVWGKLWKTKNNAFCTLAKKIGLDSPEKFNHLVREVIICHDLGKGTYRWQEYIESKGKKGKITHTLFSFFLYGQIRQWPKGDIYFTAAALAILAHHQMLHTNAFSHESIDRLGIIKFYKEELESYTLKRLGTKVNIPEEIKAYEAAEQVEKVKLLTKRIVEEENINFKRVYCVLLSLLTFVDNLASAGYIQQFINPLETIWQGFKASDAAVKSNDLQREIIAKVKAGNTNLLVQAGCGTGKTGAALLAGLEMVEGGVIDKVIFTLPTKFTSNSMYWDFITEKYSFPSDDVGIYHSEIQSLLAQDEGDEDESNIKFVKNLNCWYSKPLNISTIDHLLYSLLHCYRYADRAFGHLQTSLIIFDEIHYYDETLLAKIGQCLQILRQLAIPHIVMSATLPESMQKALNDEAEFDESSYQLIQVFKNPDYAASKIHLQTAPIILEGEVNEDFLEKIAEHLSLKQMVVVNQVERAKLITRKLKECFPDINLLCYHSQFTRIHREKKERLIKILFKSKETRNTDEVEFIEAQGFANTNQILLVTTQICELSLDISAYRMFSEIAPIDSLIQRAGRLHRKGISPDPRKCGCNDCKALNINGFLYGLYTYPVEWENKIALLPYSDRPEANILRESWSILENSEGILSDFNGVKWVNQLYQKPPRVIDNDMLEMIKEDFVFGRKPGERFGDDKKDHSEGSFRVRENILPTVVAVPASLYSPENPEDSLENYGVQVNRSRLFRQEKVKYTNHNGIWILNLPYDEELGFDFPR
ncbi:MAG: CRISPR-associated helicase Cas3' [Bacillota bacterium]